MDARFQQLKKQVSKEANQLDRAGAFKTIMEGLLSPEPKTPGMLPLWEELFANAPDADKVLMLESSPTTRKATAGIYSAVHLTNPLSARARGTAVCLGGRC